MRWILPFTALAAVGCSTPANTPLVADGGRIFPVAPAAACGVGTGGSGDKFSDLYRDIFSDKGTARCQNAACHAGDAKDGAGVFGMGEGQASAYKAFTTFDTSYMPTRLVAVGADAKTKSFLPTLVHPTTITATGQGIMPRTLSTLKNCKLTDDQLKRIESWLGRGAPED